MSLHRVQRNPSQAAERIEFLVLKVLEGMKNDTPYEPTDDFLHPVRKRKAAYFNNHKEGRRSTVQIKPFTDQTGALLIVSLTSLQVIRENRSISKRALFYLYPGLFKTQQIVDHAVDQLAFLMSADRPELNIFQATKGEACGHLTLRSRQNALTVESDRKFDFMCDEGLPIPVNLSDMEIVNAPRWILVVEKYAVYQRLVEVKYGFNSGGLIITGRGMPDRATRNLLSVLSTQVPSFALVDGDPCGFDIYLTYRIGSWQMSHEKSLVSPNLRLLGVLPSQFEELQMPREALLPLSNSDKSRLVSMKRKVEARAHAEFTQDSGLGMSEGEYQNGNELTKVLNELEIFGKLNVKAEIESIESCSGGIHRGRYLTNFYLNRFLEPHLNRSKKAIQYSSNGLYVDEEPPYCKLPYPSDLENNQHFEDQILHGEHSHRNDFDLNHPFPERIHEQAPYYEHPNELEMSQSEYSFVEQMLHHCPPELFFGQDQFY